MTLEELTTDKLLEMSAEDLKKLTDEQFMELYANRYLKITRPELAEKPHDKNTVKVLGDSRSSRQRKFDLAEKLAEQLGIDLDLSDI